MKTNNPSGTTALAARILATGCMAVAAASAQAVPFEYQGSVRHITPLANGNVQLGCGNVNVVVTPQTTVRSPAARLTLADLANPQPFPAAGFSPLTGQPRAGFVGTTCVAIGDDALVPGQYTVTDLTVEVEENSLIGATVGGPGVFNISGVPVTPLQDTRMPATKRAAGFYNANGTHPADGLLTSLLAGTSFTETARNDAGVGIDLATVPANTLAAADGYFGTDGRFHAYNIEASGGNLLRTEPRPAAQRAECENEVGRGGRDKLEVRGGCVMPAGATAATVTVEGLLANGTLQSYGTASCVPSVDLPVPAGAPYALGLYRFRSSTLTLTNDVCPASVRVRTTQAGATRYDWIAPDAR